MEEDRVTLKHKFMALPIGLVPLAIILTAWVLSQENCCNWSQVLTTLLFAVPFAVALAIIAMIVRVLLLRIR